MGVLKDLLNFGDAGQAAKSSLDWGTDAAGLSAAGQLFQGIGGYQASTFASKIASANADIAKQNAQVASQAGDYEASASLLRSGLEQGTQKAAQAANGIDVNIGSPVAVRQSTAEVSALDAAMIKYNAARQAYGNMTEAASLSAQSKMDKMAAGGELTSGLFKTSSSLLSSASSLGSKWAAQRLAFGTP